MKFFHDKELDEVQISSKQGFDGGLLKLWVDKVTLPNGKEATREIIKHQGAVGMLPILPDGRMVFVKQCRYAVGSVIYEIPAGKLEIGEEHLPSAKRELSEETGYTAAKWTYLTSIVTTPGFTNETIHLYLAENLTLSKPHPDEDEFLQVVALTPEQVKNMVLNQEIFDAKTLAALFMYAMLKKEL
jgi:ADP-ribose pyrophosphatase